MVVRGIDTYFVRLYMAIAIRLIPALYQWSALLVAPDRTEWINIRPEVQR